MDNKNKFVREVAEKKYEYGFTTDVQTEVIDKGLSEDVVRLISEKKGEPDWLLEFRLNAFRYWQTLEAPTWGHLKMPEIDYQDISYYANPTAGKSGNSGNTKEIDPELMKTFDKLGIPLEERLALSGTAVDAVMDSVSVKTTFREKLKEKGIIFYFRINARGTGQFERTLIVCDDDAYVSYLEGCTAPMRDENQLHAAIVEIVVKENAEVKYSTVQNWYPGDAEGKGGVLNLVTKRGHLRGRNSRLSWT